MFPIQGSAFMRSAGGGPPTKCVDIRVASSQGIVCDSDHDAQDSSPDRTVEQWIKYKTLPSGGGYAWGPRKYHSVGNKKGTLVGTQHISGSTFQVSMWYSSSGSNNFWGSWNVTLVVDTWYHFAYRWRVGQAVFTDKMLFSMDGVDQGTMSVGASSSTTSIYNTDQRVIFGDDAAFWVGPEAYVMDCRWWDIYRTNSAVAAGMNSFPSPSASGLVTHYRCQEGGGDTVADSTSNGFDATTNKTGVWVNDSPASHTG
jgi:hypothetical protein